MSQATPNPSTLKEYPQGSIEYQLSRQFTDEHLAAYRTDLQKAAEKLGLELTEENLTVIAREMRDMKAAEKNIKK